MRIEIFYLICCCVFTICAITEGNRSAISGWLFGALCEGRIIYDIYKNKKDKK